jgi:hypothetical protein
LPGNLYAKTEFHNIDTFFISIGDPGRVVNLLPSESKVWGVAFQIDDQLWTQEVTTNDSATYFVIVEVICTNAIF